MKKTAQLSECGKHRFTLTRQWDERPALVVVMFNPSTADAEQDDPTISLLCHIASHNGFGSIVVVNAISLRTSDADAAAEYLRETGQSVAWVRNMQHVAEEVMAAGAVLFAWGALAEKTEDWLEGFRTEVLELLPPTVPAYCLRKTKAGHPLHPMARGKMKVPKNAPLIPWVP